MSSTFAPHTREFGDHVSDSWGRYIKYTYRSLDSEDEILKSWRNLIFEPKLHHQLFVPSEIMKFKGIFKNIKLHAPPEKKDKQDNRVRINGP